MLRITPVHGSNFVTVRLIGGSRMSTRPRAWRVHGGWSQLPSLVDLRRRATMPVARYGWEKSPARCSSLNQYQPHLALANHQPPSFSSQPGVSRAPM